MHSIEDIKSKLPSLCERLGILWVDVFGSFARDEVSDSSDLDLLIEFDSEFDAPISRRFFSFLREVEEIFGGRVDVLTEKSIKNPILKKSIERDRIRIYG